jgi:beta-lactam-binding protein with PASTA domain
VARLVLGGGPGRCGRRHRRRARGDRWRCDTHARRAGLALADAKQALADAETDPAAITVVEVAAALAPGTVVAQDPFGGEAITGRTELKVAKEAVMPETAGQDERAVVDELSAFGARVLVEQRYVLSAKAGTVVRAQPAPGQPVPLDVTVVVAATPSSVYVDGVSLLSGGRSSAS